MGTVATTTATNPCRYPGNRLVAKVNTQNLIIVLVPPTVSGGPGANDYVFRKSVDGGTNWSTLATVTKANIADVGSIFVDNYGWIFWVYRLNESSLDKILFRRISSSTGAFGNEQIIGQAGNGGTGGAVYSGLDVVTHYNTSTGWHHIAVAVGYNSGGNQGLRLFGGTIDPSGNNFDGNYRFSGTTTWLYAGSGGRVGPCIDKEHNGDGYAGSPNLWVAFGRTWLRMVKVPWSGDGWTGAPGSTQILSTMAAADTVPARWDGNRFLICAVDNISTDMVNIYERDRGNSTTTGRQSPSHPTGTVRQVTHSYDPNTGNIRLYAVGTSTAVLYYIDYIRASNTWTSWTSTALTIIGSGVDNFGARISDYGGAAAGAHYGLLTATGTTPFTITYTRQAVSFAPDAPTWAAPTDGAAQDVGASLLLDWNFTDYDTNDTQSAYAVSRQIGAGALNYWRASDSTWQVAEVKNTSATSAITLTSGWAAASDANYTFKAKVWDASDTASGYGPAVVVVPSTPVNPAYTAPASGGTITEDHVTVTWTAAEQTQFRIRLNIQGGAQVYDSGWIAEPATRTFTIPYVLANSTAWTLTLNTRNLEGLSSADQTRNFSVSYVLPPSPTVLLTPMPVPGVIRATITNPAPSGSQPVFADQELWHRPVATEQTPLNTNPYFETDTSGWVGTNASIARSTAQFHQGAAACLVTPSGSGTNAYTESTPRYNFGTTPKRFRARAWLRATTTNKPLTVHLLWFDSSDVFVSRTQVDVPSVAGVWIFVAVEADPPSGTIQRVSMGAGVTSTPGVGDTVYVDEAILTVADTNPGARVGKALTSGAVVDDFWAVSGVNYEYLVLARGINGTTCAGAWTT